MIWITFFWFVCHILYSLYYIHNMAFNIVHFSLIFPIKRQYSKETAAVHACRFCFEIRRPLFPFLCFISTVDLMHDLSDYRCHVLDWFIYERKTCVSCVGNITVHVLFIRWMSRVENHVSIIRYWRSYCKRRHLNARNPFQKCESLASGGANYTVQCEQIWFIIRKEQILDSAVILITDELLKPTCLQLKLSPSN